MTTFCQYTTPKGVFCAVRHLILVEKCSTAIFCSVRNYIFFTNFVFPIEYQRLNKQL